MAWVAYLLSSSEILRFLQKSKLSVLLLRLSLQNPVNYPMNQDHIRAIKIKNRVRALIIATNTITISPVAFLHTFILIAPEKTNRVSTNNKKPLSNQPNCTCTCSSSCNSSVARSDNDSVHVTLPQYCYYISPKLECSMQLRCFPTPSSICARIVRR